MSEAKHLSLRSPERINAFSDGVLAIVTTINPRVGSYMLMLIPIAYGLTLAYNFRRQSR